MPSAETRQETAAEAPSRGAAAASGAIRVDGSLVRRATAGDKDALRVILRQFIEAEEPIEWCEYLGVLGIPPFGEKSFAVLTNTRIGTLRIGWFGQVMYQDAPLEYTVSGLVVQPGKAGLYLNLFFVTLLFLLGTYTAMLMAPEGWLIRAAIVLVAPILLALLWSVTAKIYYRFNKCGMVWAVREGLWVYAFANRGRMIIANRLYRRAVELREIRIRSVRPVP